LVRNALHLSLQSVLILRSDVTWELMEAVGWETTACKREITVLHLVIPHFLLNVWREKWPVTWELMEAVGGEITAFQREITAPQLVTVLFLLNVWREK